MNNHTYMFCCKLVIYLGVRLIAFSKITSKLWSFNYGLQYVADA